MKILVVALSTLTIYLSASTVYGNSLRDIYELALENDAQLKAEEATYLANRETENLSRSALLPQVSTGYTYEDSETDTKGFGPDFTKPGLPQVQTKRNLDTDTDGYFLTLNQALFDLSAWFSFQSGKQITKQAEAIFASDQQDLIVRTVDAYLQVLRAQDNLSASSAQERAFERQLEQTQQRFEVGLIAITDVYEARAARDLAQVERLVDENNVQVALEGLTVLTGQPNHGDLNVLVDDFEIRPPVPADRAAWVDFSLASNFQLLAARYQEEAARQTAKSNAAGHAPTVTGSYQYSDYDVSGSQTITPATGFGTDPKASTDQHMWKIEVTLPLYSGGAVSANRRKAAQEYNAAVENRINLQRNIVTNTRSLHMTVVSDVSRIAARKQSIVSSKSSLDATQAGYEVGTRNVVDVLNAQNTLFSAERDYANSRYDYILDMMNLKQQAGLLSPEDVLRLDSFMVPPTSAAAASVIGTTKIK
ncbi:MAG: TolC family outer membrane protein [Halioglobus sp.]|nr:TolC family outer membrane protein [Halieaceae bacterium]MDG2411284.1 TolC family outer membrane protein [Halioglobus sp.]